MITATIREHPLMAHFTVRLGGMIEATCDNLAVALHKADTWAKRYREVYTVHRGDELVATATHKHTTMEAAIKADATHQFEGLHRALDKAA